MVIPTFFLCIRLCISLNEVSIEQLFFILLHLAFETSSNDRTHRLPESKCGETGLKKKESCYYEGRFFFFALLHHIAWCPKLIPLSEFCSPVRLWKSNSGLVSTLAQALKNTSEYKGVFKSLKQ